MCRTLFTSDIHIGHKKVAEIRGFGTDVAKHDATIAENWDAAVRCSKCIIYFLGDLSVGYGMPERNALAWIAERRGIKRCIPGNHDGPHPMHSGSHRAEVAYRRVFETVRPIDQVRIEGQKVLLSHFPYLGSRNADHTDVIRYPQWRPTDHGQWLLHGHTHKADQVYHDGRQIHVGVDAHDLCPVELGTIASIIRKVENEPIERSSVASLS